MVLWVFAAETESMNSENLIILLNIQRLILLCTVNMIKTLKIWEVQKREKEKQLLMIEVLSSFNQSLLDQNILHRINIWATLHNLFK